MLKYTRDFLFRTAMNLDEKKGLGGVVIARFMFHKSVTFVRKLGFSLNIDHLKLSKLYDLWGQAKNMSCGVQISHCIRYSNANLN